MRGDVHANCVCTTQKQYVYPRLRIIVTLEQSDGDGIGAQEQEYNIHTVCSTAYSTVYSNKSFGFLTISPVY